MPPSSQAQLSGISSWIAASGDLRVRRSTTPKGDGGAMACSACVLREHYWTTVSFLCRASFFKTVVAIPSIGRLLHTGGLFSSRGFV